MVVMTEATTAIGELTLDEDVDVEEEQVKLFPLTLLDKQLPESGFPRAELMPLQHIKLFLPFFVPMITEAHLDHLRKCDLPFFRDENIPVQLLKILAIEDEKKRTSELYTALNEWCKDYENAVIFVCIAVACLEFEEKQFLIFNRIQKDAFAVYEYYIMGIGNPTSKPDVIDRLAATFYMDEVIQYLKHHSNDVAYMQVGTRLDFLWQEGTQLARWQARCKLIIELVNVESPKKHSMFWFNEFLIACSRHPRTAVFARYLVPDVVKVNKLYQLHLQAASAPSRMDDDLVCESVEVLAPRPQSEFDPKLKEESRIPGAGYELYSYQHELVGKAKQGVNTVICAPTGSGKTVVALDILVSHLQFKRQCQSVGRVVMFVPTIPLVEQQYKSIYQKVGTEFYVTKLSGAERVKSESKEVQANDILSSEVVVMTPQMFVNMLVTPLKKQKLYIADFTLMIFDECHHCDHQHPYNVVMEHVRAAKIQPQIVGLTASVGTGKGNKGNDIMAAIKHITALCARLNCVMISSVRDPNNVRELRERVSNPIDTFYQLRPANPDEFAHRLALVMDGIQSEMNVYLKKMTQAIPDLAKFLALPMEKSSHVKNGCCKTAQLYSHGLLIIRNIINKNESTHKADRLIVLKLIKLLQKFYIALKTNELFPARLANSYLKSELFEYRQHECKDNELLNVILTEAEDQLKPIDEVLINSEEKPILKKLFDILRQQYKENNDSRIIIFVELRKAAAELAKYIGTHDAITSSFGYGRVDYVTSTNQTATRFGQSKEEQSTALRKFDKGDYNILIATSVADEGLDVATCNLVIKYNSVGSEKSYIQRKGRARSIDSKSILLALDYDLQMKEYTNILKSYMMNICVERLQTMSERELKTLIDDAVKKLRLEDAHKRAAEAEREKYLSRNVYTMECSECGTQFCHTNQLRFLAPSHVIVCFSQAWKDTSVVKRTSSKGKKEFGMNVGVFCGDWRCKCGKIRGEVIKYAEIFLPTLNAESFNLRNIDYQRSRAEIPSKLKWRDIMANYINVPSITGADVREMSSALSSFEAIYKEAVSCELDALIASENDKPKYTVRDETFME